MTRRAASSMQGMERCNTRIVFDCMWRLYGGVAASARCRASVRMKCAGLGSSHAKYAVHLAGRVVFAMYPVFSSNSVCQDDKSGNHVRPPAAVRQGELSDNI